METPRADTGRPLTVTAKALAKATSKSRPELATPMGRLTFTSSEPSGDHP